MRRTILLLLLFFGCFVGTARGQTGTIVLSVTSSPSNITVNVNCNYVVVEENSATPSNPYTITLPGNATGITYQAGARFVFSAGPQGFIKGQVLGSIVVGSGTVGFIGIESIQAPTLPSSSSSGGSSGNSLSVDGVVITNPNLQDSTYNAYSVSGSNIQLTSDNVQSAVTPLIPYYNQSGTSQIVGPSNLAVTGVGLNVLSAPGGVQGVSGSSLIATGVNNAGCTPPSAGSTNLYVGDPTYGVDVGFGGTSTCNGVAIQNNNATFASMIAGGPDPWIDVKAEGAAGSTEETTGSVISGQASITLAAPIDFVNGEGLSMQYMGPVSTLTPPTVAVVPQGTTGSTDYYYTVAAVDAGGGASGYNARVEITNGNATLSGTNFNAIYVTPVSGTRLYCLIGRGSSSTTVLQCMPWEEDTTSYTATASRTSDLVTVTVTGPIMTLDFSTYNYVTMSGCSDSTFDGTFIVGDTASNTFSYAQTDSNSTATGCSVTVDPTFLDFGTTYPIPTNLNIASTATNDWFSATITGGAGTTSLTLSASPSETASGQAVYHDDTAAFQAAISDANASSFPGVFCPPGTYSITSDLAIASGFNLLGASYTWASPSCTIVQNNPGADIFRAGYPAEATGVYITDVTLDQGRIAIDSVYPGGLSALKVDGVTIENNLNGARISANAIQWDFRHFLFETADWAVDESPAANVQGIKFDTGWMGASAQGFGHWTRFPATTGLNNNIEFDNVIWEGPASSWIINSATPFGAENVWGNVVNATFKSNSAADVGTTNVNFLQSLPVPDGTPVTINFDSNEMYSESSGYIFFIPSNGTSNGPVLNFVGGFYHGGTGVYGYSGFTYPIVTNIGADLTPTPSNSNLVQMNDGVWQSPTFLSGGQPFTISGCSATSATGNGMVGSYTSGTSGTCTVTVTWVNNGNFSAPHGWACWANDLTTTADKQGQTGGSTTTAIFSGTTVSGDVVNFGCLPY